MTTRIAGWVDSTVSSGSNSSDRECPSAGHKQTVVAVPQFALKRPFQGTTTSTP